MSLITPRRALIGAATAGIVLASQPSLIASPALILPPAVAEQMERRGIVEPHRRMPDIENVMAMLMMAKMSGMLSGEAAPAALLPQDVFSTTLYTGTTGDKDLNTGVNLAAGGMLWIKQRDSTANHYLMDSERGVARELYSNSTAGQALTGNVGSFTAVGAYLNGGVLHTNGNTYAAWSFRRAPKFFDVVTWTGTGATGLIALNHALGVAPGFFVIKRTDASSAWYAYHRSLGNGQYLSLNATDAAGDVSSPTGWAVSSTTFSHHTSQFGFNSSGATYVAYLFAHDTAAAGLVRCGSLSTDEFGQGAVSEMEWQPQFLMFKNASGTGDWEIFDSARGVGSGGADYRLRANTSGAETLQNRIDFSSTGFSLSAGGNQTYVYLAIRAAV